MTPAATAPLLMPPPRHGCPRRPAAAATPPCTTLTLPLLYPAPHLPHRGHLHPATTASGWQGQGRAGRGASVAGEGRSGVKEGWVKVEQGGVAATVGQQPRQGGGVHGKGGGDRLLPLWDGRVEGERGGSPAPDGHPSSPHSLNPIIPPQPRRDEGFPGGRGSRDEGHLQWGKGGSAAVIFGHTARSGYNRPCTVAPRLDLASGS